MRLKFLTFCAAVLFAATPAVASETETLDGVIKSYECGDNCYLTITTDAGEERSGLCAAPACQPWNEVAEMPADQIGRAVTVMVGVGRQVDGSGNDMGEFEAFNDVQFK
jgi:hypothetical protein